MPLPMSVAEMKSLALTAEPLRVSDPAPGSVVTFTASRAFPSESLNPKSAAVKV